MDYNVNTCIGVKTSFEALHRWKDAPDDVKFLRNYHRHIFHVIVRLPVAHDDRQLEFFVVKRLLDTFIKATFGILEIESVLKLRDVKRETPGKAASTGTGMLRELDESCESIAKTIAKFAISRFPGIAWCCVHVSEDDENFAETTLVATTHLKDKLDAAQVALDTAKSKLKSGTSDSLFCSKCGTTLSHSREERGGAVYCFTCLPPTHEELAALRQKNFKESKC